MAVMALKVTVDRLFSRRSRDFGPNLRAWSAADLGGLETGSEPVSRFALLSEAMVTARVLLYEEIGCHFLMVVAVLLIPRNLNIINQAISVN